MMQWLNDMWRRHVVQDLPDELARCESTCVVLECRQGRWENCKARLLLAERIKQQRSQNINSASLANDA